MADKVLFARLSGQTSAGTRVYPLILPQTPTLPAITYQIISVTRQHMFGQDAETETYRVQIDCWASTYAQARTLSDEVFARLSRFRGTVGSSEVHDIAADNETALYEPDTKLHRITQDYRLFTAAL